MGRILLLTAAVKCYKRRHVHRIGTQSRLAACHPVARKLSRGGPGQKAHSGQSFRLADRAGRGLSHAAEGRGRRRRGPDSHPPRAAARPRRRGAGHAAGDWPRPAAWQAGRQALGAIGDSVDCRPPDRARLQARHCARAGRGHRRLEPGPAIAAGSGRRGRALSRARLARRATERDRDRARAPPPQRGALVLYDVSSSWLEGRCCELARFGHSRDGKKGKLQIVYGLLCAADGCPVAVEVFAGNTADPMTLATQIDKLKGRFGLSRVVLVGDRGMITSARIRDELKPAGLDWITALRAPQIRTLLDTGAFQLSLFSTSRRLSVVKSDPLHGYKSR